MCKHKNQKFIGENTGPNPLYWCENCGVFINGEYIKLLKLINKLVETTNEQPERIEKCGCPYNKCFCLVDSIVRTANITKIAEVNRNDLLLLK